MSSKKIILVSFPFHSCDANIRDTGSKREYDSLAEPDLGQDNSTPAGVWPTTAGHQASSAIAS